MATDLTGIDRKLRRAEEHLDAFRTLEAEWERQQQQHLVIKPETDPRLVHDELVQFRMEVAAVVPVDKATSAVVGDCIQNMRAALDHLAYQLVIANDGTPDETTAFPIFDSRFHGDNGNPRTIRISGGIDTRALAIVEAAQPYHRGSPEEVEMDLLWILKQLSNIDKHRLLVVLAEAAVENRIELGRTGPDLGLPMGGGGGYAVRRVRGTMRPIGRPLEAHTHLGSVGIQASEFHKHPHVKGYATFAIALADAEVPGATREPVALLLQEVLEAVGGVIDSLRLYTLPAAFRG